MKTLIWLAVIISLASGCTMKQKIMDASLVSMTHANVPEGATLQDRGSVTGQFCTSLSSDKGAYGLFDEAVKNAQTKSGVDFIANATFWNEGGCVTVEGAGQKIVLSSVAANSKMK